MSDLSRIEALEKRVAALEAGSPRLGPQPIDEGDRAESVSKIVEELLAKVGPPPTDWDARVLADGSPVTPDHREIQPETGQQKAYVVLSEEERSKGYVRPIRRSYIHQKCGALTQMGLAIAQTYAREPKFYSGTFCCHCRDHFPVGQDGEFTWEDGSKVGS